MNLGNCTCGKGTIRTETISSISMLRNKLGNVMDLIDMKSGPNVELVLSMMARIIGILSVSVTPMLKVLCVVVALVGNMVQQYMVIISQLMK